MAKVKKHAPRDTELIEYERELGTRGSLHDFVQMAWPLVEPAREFVDGWHIGAMCEHLEAVTDEEIKRLLINIPPGCMKSLTCSVLWPAWNWIRQPGWRGIFASFDQSLVGKRDGGKVLEIVLSPWYQDRWGDRVSILGAEPSAGDFETTARGFRFATSVGGRLMGRHGNALVVDDPIKPQDVSELTLSEAQRWRKETVASRLLPGGAVVIMMQRVHEKDPAGCAEEEGGYEVLKLPMRFVSDMKCHTKLGFTDPRTEEGELLFPQYKDEEEVQQIEKDMGGAQSATVSAQLQQSPAPAKGLLFQKDHFQYYKELPKKFDFVVDSWDCTFKSAETSDFVCGQRWGRVGSAYYLLARVHGRMGFAATCAAIRTLQARTDLPKPHAVLIEDKANGSAVIETLQKEISGIVVVNPEGGKETRAQAITPLYEARNVWHPDKSIAPWIEAHEAELLKFPKGKHDDSVDAETQALTYLRQKASAFAAAMNAVIKSGFSFFS